MFFNFPKSGIYKAGGPSMERKIVVKGVGKVEARPDWVEVRLSILSFGKVYSEAFDRAQEGLEALKSSFEGIGFKHQDIKTTDFDVSVKRESKKTKTGFYQEVVKGYEIKHNMLISFAFDNKRLSSVLDTIATLISKPSVDVRFTVKDSEKLKDKLLEMAAKDAMRKARVLALSASVRLGKLVSINYSCSDLNFYSDTNFDRCLMPEGESTRHFDMEVNDICITDTVTFEWMMED